MTYKVPYITVKMILPNGSQIHNRIPYTDKKKFTANTQKMLASPSDFRLKLERTSNSY